MNRLSKRFFGPTTTEERNNASGSRRRREQQQQQQQERGSLPSRHLQERQADSPPTISVNSSTCGSEVETSIEQQQQHINNHVVSSSRTSAIATTGYTLPPNTPTRAPVPPIVGSPRQQHPSYYTTGNGTTTPSLRSYYPNSPIMNGPSTSAAAAMAAANNHSNSSAVNNTGVVPNSAAATTTTNGGHPGSVVLHPGAISSTGPNGYTPTPSICGSCLNSKRSVLAFTWSLTTILTLFAFLLAIGWTIQVNAHYRYLYRTYGNYYNDDVYNNNNNNRYLNEDENGEDQQNSHDSQDEQQQEEMDLYFYLAKTRSAAIGFVAIYVMSLAMALMVYGSTTIVGFMSLRGVYIAPCFSSSIGGISSKMKVGMFGGALVVFCNLLMLCGVILGEFRVADYFDEREKEELNEPYAVERIATILAVTCMFLAVLYSIFAILLFLHISGNGSDGANSSGNGRSGIMTTSHHHHHEMVPVEGTGMSKTDPLVVGSHKLHYPPATLR